MINNNNNKNNSNSNQLNKQILNKLINILFQVFQLSNILMDNMQTKDKMQINNHLKRKNSRVDSLTLKHLNFNNSNYKILIIV